AQAELARVTRVTVMGELATSIAHEINQPLTAIITNSDTCLHWLSKENINLAQARAAVNRLQQNARHACEVIGRIRNLLGRKSPERTQMNINDVLRETMSLVGPELRTRKVAVVTHFSEPAVPVIADRVQLQQVILNLVMNAIEAMCDKPEA